MGNDGTIPVLASVLGGANGDTTTSFDDVDIEHVGGIDGVGLRAVGDRVGYFVEKRDDGGVNGELLRTGAICGDCVDGVGNIAVGVTGYGGKIWFEGIRATLFEDVWRRIAVVVCVIVFESDF